MTESPAFDRFKSIRQSRNGQNVRFRSLKIAVSHTNGQGVTHTYDKGVSHTDFEALGVGLFVRLGGSMASNCTSSSCPAFHLIDFFQQFRFLT